MSTHFGTVALVAGSLLAVSAAAGARESYTRMGAAEWSLGNNLVERTIRFTAERGLCTTSWRHKLTGTEVIRGASCEEFSFQLGDRAISGRSGFRLAGAASDDLSNGKLLRVKLRGDGVDVEVFYAVYDGHPAVRKWITVTNTGARSAVLRHLCFEQVAAAPGDARDLQVRSGYGTIPRETFFTGRASDVAMVSKNSRTGEGLVVLNEAPGFLKRTQIDWSGEIRVMYDTDLFPFARTIEPGESFQTAKSSILLFAEGKGLADERWVVPGYTSQIVMRRGSHWKPLWVYNTWEPFMRSIDEATTADLIKVAGRMGMDVFTIDDGWQLDYGSNQVDTKKFPGGLFKVRALLNEQGMGLGLWVPLAAISANTPEFRAHPEWQSRDRQGRLKYTGTASGDQPVMCLGTPYREVAAKRLIDLIEQEHVKYLKVDLTTVFNAYGEEPGCNAPGHNHKSWAESLVRIYEGLQYVGERVYREHPEVLIDYTFELWGEKHLIDPALLAVADLDWLSNVPDNGPLDAGPRQARTLLYQRALAIPVESMLIGNLQAEMRPIAERFGAAIGSGPLLLGDLRKLTGAEQDWYREKIGWYKKLRSQTSLQDSFFSLGDWAPTGVKTWDGFARLSRSGGGMIVIFANDSGASKIEIRLVAPPGANYRARSVMSGRALGTVTAADFARGWVLPLTKNEAVEVIELLPAGS